jgi:hypothetical protein
LTPAGQNFKTLWINLPKGTYTLSFGVSVNLIRKIIDGVYAGSVSGGTNVKTYTFTTNGGKVGFSWRRNDDAQWVDNTPIQIEIGDKATEYEPFVGCRYTADEDGNIECVTSIYPITTLTTTNDLIISAEYNRDINLVIDNLERTLEQVAIALGGNI